MLEVVEDTHGVHSRRRSACMLGGMYVPAFNAVEDEAEVRALVESVGSGWLVTSGDGSAAPAATLLPVLWREDRVRCHLARANPHWRSMVDGMRALLIVTGPQAYVSPSWYASKAEHGRVVPTWNYVAVQLSGSLVVRHEPAWLLDLVTALTDRHEAARAAGERWQVDDAPPEVIASQLKAIVGVELLVDTVEAKAKLSQNRSAADQQGVVDGLRRESQGASPGVPELMREEGSKA
jgi:transcriptional regulator